MPYYLKAKKIDIRSGLPLFVLLHERDALAFGIRAGDKIQVKWSCCTMPIEAHLTDSEVKRGEIGFYEDIWAKNKLEPGEIVEITLLQRPTSIQSIKKKLLGKKLSYDEMDSIVKDIVDHRLSDIELTYFVASSFVHEYSLEELYYLTKSIAENGEMLKFKEPVADKHSIGGLPGNRTTMVAIPIIASLGLTIPKTSSRAITSPAGTADTMEVLAPVSFDASEVKKLVDMVGACLVWGGGINIAPADDKIIRISYPLAIEPYTKMLVSIMAKKVAMGITHLIIDMPVGPTAKVVKKKTARKLARKLIALGQKFGIKVEVIIVPAFEPIGRGIGPALEARDVLRVLQQHPLRPLDLEAKSILLAGKLLELVGKTRRGNGAKMASEVLKNKKAWRKMQEIIKAQGGNSDIKADEVTLGAITDRIYSNKKGRIVFIDNKKINEICRILGAPGIKLGGVHLHRRIGDKIEKGQKLFTLYGENDERVKLALKTLETGSIFQVR